jgi:hypothetical protein
MPHRKHRQASVEKKMNKIQTDCCDAVKPRCNAACGMPGFSSKKGHDVVIIMLSER